MLGLFSHYKDRGLTIYSEEDAKTFYDKLVSVIALIKKDKEARLKQMKALAGKVDEEDMEYFLEDLEKVDKGIHHIMEINGAIMQNMGEQVSAHVGQHLLPHYAMTLLNINGKKDYELIDSVCFICDCLEHGSMAMFNQVSG